MNKKGVKSVVPTKPIHREEDGGGSGHGGRGKERGLQNSVLGSERGGLSEGTKPQSRSLRKTDGSSLSIELIKVEPVVQMNFDLAHRLLSLPKPKELLLCAGIIGKQMLLHFIYICLDDDVGLYFTFPLVIQ